MGVVFRERAHKSVVATIVRSVRGKLFLRETIRVHRIVRPRHQREVQQWEGSISGVRRDVYALATINRIAPGHVDWSSQVNIAWRKLLTVSSRQQEPSNDRRFSVR